jgi:predicted dehydrogenase
VKLTQSWPRPARPRPIVIVGAGGIVRTAHLPAYRALGLPVAGLYDVRPEAARETARQFGIDTVFDSLRQACERADVVFDLALPGDQVLGVLAELPAGAPVLIQKPLGEDLAGALAIRSLCRERRLVAAVNFQLRFSPGVLALRDLLERGLLGDAVDVELRLVVEQPWQLWGFLKAAPRVEILYHSIHYLDTIRSLVGDPVGVYCRAVRHPELPELQDVRSTIVLDYGERIRCSLCLNHTHRLGPRHRASQLKIEGTGGAALLTLGVNLAYPSGGPDALEVARAGGDWESVPLRGSWFTEAFEGPMSNLQRYAAGEDDVLLTSVEDAVKTMALVEACYESSARGATPIPDVEVV